MKKITLAIILLVALGSSTYASPNVVTIKTSGHYSGKDANGKPICPAHPTHICVFQTYIVDENSVFPMGILSATYLDPDTGNDVAFNSVTQIFYSGGYILNMTFGTGWTGPFSINSSDWSF